MNKYETAKTEVEMLVDQFGLASVLTMLSEICADKADHLRCNWQDDSTAKVWAKDSLVIDKLTHKVNAS